MIGSSGSPVSLPSASPRRRVAGFALASLGTVFVVGSRISGSKPPNSASERFIAAWRRRSARGRAAARAPARPRPSGGRRHRTRAAASARPRSARLDDHAGEEAVEHDGVERLERLGNGGEQLVELGELGVAQVLAGGGAGGRDGGAGSGRPRGAARRPQPASRAAMRWRTCGSSSGRRWRAAGRARRAARARRSSWRRRGW